MVEIGKLNRLKILKEVDFGVYLDGDWLGEILLPKKYVPQNCKPDDMIEVFVYFDSEDRPIATTEKPIAMVGEFAFLKVVSVSSFGAFLDWDLPKDLLVPFREQKNKMKEGYSYLVYIYVDDETDRIVASSKLDKFFSKIPASLKPDEMVNLIIQEKTDLGYNAIINNSYQGLLYDSEIFQNLKPGLKIKGYIKKIRDDGKIDLTLNKPGFGKVDELSQIILDKLKENDGLISIGDKSDPQLIYKLFGVSKKTYKKAIGTLFKKRLITIDESGIRLSRNKN